MQLNLWFGVLYRDYYCRQARSSNLLWKVNNISENIFQIRTFYMLLRKEVKKTVLLEYFLFYLTIIWLGKEAL